MSFSEIIVGWYGENKRDLPWRNTRDAYKIWLSEIILQQTRVAQGMPYYYKFTERFKDINALANASEDEVLKLWQGLGYYSRARNMHATAKIVAQQYNGIFPNTYKEILQLKGIGKYTAAAIASLAFDEAVPVVDGNVYRVLSRCFGIDEPIDSGKGQKTFYDLAEQLIDHSIPGTYNQAIMEFGALYCKPQNPDCANCVLNALCIAFKQKRVDQLPVKAKKTQVKKRFFNYIYFDKPGHTFMQKRATGDIWANLYELPLIETPAPLNDKTALGNHEGFKNLTAGQDIKYIKNAYRLVHKLSHRDIEAIFWHVGVNADFVIKNSPIFELKIDTLHQYGVSRLTEKFITEYIDKAQ